MSVTTLWSKHSVVVTAGSGGVGKTTVAASIALAAAADGRRVLVMTIDPSRRLAYALGLHSSDHHEHQLSVDELARAGIRSEHPLGVTVPDVKTTFDRLVERLAPEDANKEAILANPIYRHLSSALAGSLDYAAIECLYEIHTSGRYDLIVLDTAPSQSAREFLDAPGRILEFLNDETLNRFLKPYSVTGRFSLKLLDLGTSLILRTLGRLTGVDTLRQLAEFILSFRGMYDGFRERSKAVQDLLRSDEVAFLLVTGTGQDQRETMERFRSQLLKEGITTRALVVNRFRQLALKPLAALSPRSDRSRSDLEPAMILNRTDELSEQVREILAPFLPSTQEQIQDAIGEELNSAEHDRKALSELQLAHSKLIILPELPKDVHHLTTLAELAAYFLQPESYSLTNRSRRDT